MDRAAKSSIECPKFKDINGKTYVDDEHILNFWSESPPTIPQWFADKTCLKICVAAGDGWDNGQLTDIERLPQYDIYINPGTYHYSAANNLLNLQYIKDYHYQKKLICYADATYLNHLDLLATLFKNKCQFIASDDPRFSNLGPEDKYGKLLLINGGKLINYKTPKISYTGISRLPEPTDVYYECDIIAGYTICTKKHIE
jgi:hypothetical protein